jgi:hypothetical protein
MPQNKITWGKVTENLVPVPNVYVQVYEKDKLFEFEGINFPIRTLLAVVPTDQEGCYEASYSPWDYAYQDMEIVVEIDPRGLRTRLVPRKPEIFIRVYVEGKSYESAVIENVDVERLELDLDCTRGTEKEDGWIQDIFDWIQEMDNIIGPTARRRLEDAVGHAGEGLYRFLDALATVIESVLPSLPDSVVDGLRDLGNFLRKACEILGREVGAVVEDLIDKLPYDFWLEHAIVGDWLDRSVVSVPQLEASTFNHCVIRDIRDKDGFTDSGKKYWFRLKEGAIEYSDLPDPAYRIRRGRFREDIVGGGYGRPPHVSPWKKLGYPLQDGLPGSNSVPTVFSYTRKRKQPGDRQDPPLSDMIAADGNRILVKEEGRDNFFFATLFDEFPKQLWDDAKREPVNVPGCYLKLDPENNQPGQNERELGWWGPRNYDHPAMLGYDMMPYLKFGLRSIAESLEIHLPDNPLKLNLLRPLRLLPDIMMIKVLPGALYQIDSRPPYMSGSVPEDLPSYNNVVYITTGVSFPDPGQLVPFAFRYLCNLEERFRSIKFEKVLSLGVANAHRHTHYEDIYGTEISSGPDHYLVGSILDRGGFWDGTCNFYLLCQLKPDHEIEAETRQSGKSPNAFGILWMDEQSYFSERWRLLSPKDNLWGPLRAWGLAAALRRGLTLENLRYQWTHPVEEQFWCPFQAGCITRDSRMAVSKYVVLVTGKVLEDRPGRPGKERHEIYSIAMNWGGMDWSWRWRLLPDVKVNFNDDLDPQTVVGSEVLPKTIAIRPDMTIHLKGSKAFVRGRRDRTFHPGRIVRGEREITVKVGRWYQRYLPADNWEVPKADAHALNGGKPSSGYTHPWKFMSEK